MKRGFDTVALSAADWRALIDPQNRDPEVLAGYVNGRWQSAQFARIAYPHAILYTYDVNGARPDADVLDVEPGDANNDQCPGWYRQWFGFRHVLPKPGFYTSASNVSALIATMSRAGISRDRYLILSAHYTHREHICGPPTCGYPQADGTQWDDKGAHGENTDRLIFADHFFKTAARKPPAPAPHYERFDRKHRLIAAGHSEQWVVRRYDTLRKTQTHASHPHRAELAILRAYCKALALRLRAIGHPTVFFRGWRRTELLKRAAGERVV